MKKCFFLLIAMLVFAATPARAEIKLNVTQGSVEPLPIAITTFYAEPGADTKLAQELPQAPQMMF